MLQFRYRREAKKKKVQYYCSGPGIGRLQHFSHKHPLIPCEVSCSHMCMGCGEGIRESCYGCKKCHSFLLHKSCVELSHELQHPVHKEHPLILHNIPPHDEGTCTCNICGDPCKLFVYRCPSCKFDIHIKCASLPLTIESEIHDHSLTLFGKLTSFTCDFCGKEGKSMPYLCGSICGFWVHHNCASLPRMVKLIRHKHPLNLTDSLKFNQSKHRLCQLCVKKVDTNYGIYHCSICDYVAHLDCATDKEGWDDIYVWEPKDNDPIESTAMLRYEDSGLDELTNNSTYIVKKTKVGEDKIEIPIEIKSFSHAHDLLLTHELENYKICDGCIRPIFPPFYSCVPCNFFLHKSCAELPRKKRHPLHEHQLLLKLLRPYLYKCSACLCRGNGFFYECDSCTTSSFRLDVSCSFISDKLTHLGHEHPFIFSSTTKDEECIACSSKREIFRCTICEFTLDFGCIILPPTIKYRQHEHLFTLRYIVEDDSGEYYCDICEEERNPNNWFYYCEECSYPAHPNCIFGGFLNSKRGDYRNIKFESTYTSTNHQHPLTLVRKIKNQRRCGKCGKPCHELACECTMCNFVSHLQCLNK